MALREILRVEDDDDITYSISTVIERADEVIPVLMSKDIKEVCTLGRIDLVSPRSLRPA
jgi:hypothetical protein